jgi:hypothetical protein
MSENYIDWDDIKLAWTQGTCNLQEKATQYEITVAEILLKAKQDNWGKRGSNFVTVDLDGKEPSEIIKQLTLANLSGLSMLFNSGIPAKDHLDIQKTIQMAKETLGMVEGDNPGNSTTKEELIELAKKRGLPVSIFI